ncbi:hypothetical protein EJB05_41014 [Eragrostis curvula]|uniref:Response regulatory domain-containing protein n=1 Tax=Eragrostis curvula TaxID=38414 RepID=A0A5J9T8K2_9POAL|nr:hypothetical protein EJB05_41014 [Eragrostis curvula]
MENLSVLVLDDDPKSLQVISKELEKLNFKVFPFETEDAALDFLKKGSAKEDELNLILAEVHVSTVASPTLANSALLNHIVNELQVPFVSMCGNKYEEVVTESMAIGSCFHLLKPLNTGNFNVLKHTAQQHKFRRSTPEGLNSFCRTASSSTKVPKEMFNLEENNLCRCDSKEHEDLEVSRARVHSKNPNRLTCKARSKKPDRLIWTVELHEKFLDAIEVLGDKFASPNRIKKQMNVKNLSSAHISSHLKKHRLHKLKEMQEGQFQQNANEKPVAELIRSAHNAADTESITPRVAANIREVYPSRLWLNLKKMAAESVSLKACSYTSTSRIYRDDSRSVWDRYYKSLEKDSSSSSRRQQYERSPKNKDAARDEGVPNEGPKTAGEIGYGAPESSNNPLTSFLGQAGKNHLTEAAGNIDSVGDISLLKGILNEEQTAAMDPFDGQLHLQSNDTVLDDINKSSNAQMHLTGPSDGQEEMNSFWMSQLKGPQEQLNIGPEDLLQVNEAWNEALVLGTQPTLINVDEPMTQEVAVGDAPAPEHVMQFAQTEEAAVGDAPAPDSVMQFAQIQEAFDGDAPAPDHVMQFAQDDIFWSLSPLMVGDYDMLL